MFGKRIRLFKIKNVPVEISLLALLLIGFNALPLLLETAFGMGSGLGLILFIIMLGIFVSVFIHELAHAVVGMGLGSTVTGIYLNFLGGVTYFAARPPAYFKDLLIFLVGPLSNFVLWQGFGMLAGLPSLDPTLTSAFGYLAVFNLFIAVFNALPAYPLDGGQAAYALVMGLTSSQKFAARTVMLFSFGAVAFIIFGPTQAILGRDVIGLVFSWWIAAWIGLSCLALHNEATTMVKFYPSSTQQYNQFQKKAGQWAANRQSGSLYERGQRQFQNAQYELALGTYTQAVELDPTNSTYLEQRAAAYCQIGEFGRALHDYNQLLDKHKDARRATVYVHRANLYWRLGQPERAKADLKQALRLDPHELTALTLQAQLVAPV